MFAQEEGGGFRFIRRSPSRLSYLLKTLLYIYIYITYSITIINWLYI
jgi:hypothetical protein